MARNFVRASNEFIELATAPVTGVPFTISAWARTDVDTGSDDYCIVQLQDQGSAANYFRLNTDDSFGAAAGEFSFSVTGGGSFTGALSSVKPTIGQWYHVCAIAAATNDRRILVDGGNEGTNTNTREPTGIDSITIGREGDSSPSDTWSGDIGEVAVWNVALTDVEIASLAVGYSPLFIRPGNLVFYAPIVRDLLDRISGGILTTSGTTVANHPPILYPAPPIFVTAPAAAGAETKTQTYQVDFILQRTDTQTHLIDFVLTQAAKQQTHVVDFAVQRQLDTQTHLIDFVLLQDARTQTHLIDFVLTQAARQQTHLIDFALQRQLDTQTHLIDFVLQRIDTQTHIVDFAVQRQLDTQTHLIDFVLSQDARQQTYIVDVRLSGVGTQTHIVDFAVLRQNDTQTHLIDFALQRTDTQTHLIDFTLQRTDTQTHLIDFVLSQAARQQTHEITFIGKRTDTQTYIIDFTLSSGVVTISVIQLQGSHTALIELSGKYDIIINSEGRTNSFVSLNGQHCDSVELGGESESVVILRGEIKG